MRMARNHGMTRGMPDRYKNSQVDESFDFFLLGSNYRTTNLIAYMHSLDFDRSLKWSEENRRQISEEFYRNLDQNKFYVPHNYTGRQSEYIPLAIPIIRYAEYGNIDLIEKVKTYLKSVGVGYRGLVGSNLLRHTAFKNLGDPESYSGADYLHFNSIYIGLHAGVTKKMAFDLAQELNKL